MKKSLQPDMQTDQLPNFKDIESRVFTEHKGKIYIGAKEIKPEYYDVLREQSRYFLTSQLYELLDETITNESANLALVQSTEWDHVLSAKMLHHWNFVLKNLMVRLTEQK